MTKPDLSEERKLFGRKFDLVIGVDEVGRGALAGPVVAGAVAIGVLPARSSLSRSAALSGTKCLDSLPSRLRDPSRRHPEQENKNNIVDWENLGIDDSKRLTGKKRYELAKIIEKHTVWGIGEVSVSYINEHGIVKATEKAMRAAVAALNKFNEVNKINEASKKYLLVDAFYIRYAKNIGLKNQKAIVKGDQKSISIAAASIIAKVHRDKLMARLHHKGDRGNRVYRWEKNKGYGTKDHREAIRKYGVTKFHRKDFVD